MIEKAPQELRPRPRIGRYVVTGRIGRGGMGMVYRGLDEALEREVAVKTLKLEGSLDDESRRRFEVEAKAAARLQHPNIVTVYELGEDRGLPFIAMELLPGCDLEALMRSGDPIPLAEKLEITIQVCRGLAFAHERGIIHRDVKPSNIRVLDDGTAKIMDFGIAKLGGMNLTRSGMMVGTVHYMSPEQVRGATLDGRSDVFSVGVILYELLCGERPFRGEGITEILYRIVHDAPPPVRADLGIVSDRLCEVIEKALVKDASERYASAGALADALSVALGEHREAEGSGALPREALDELSGVRKLIKVGNPDEAKRRLESLGDRYPGSAEVWRTRRAAEREAERRRRGSDVEDEYPELGGTFEAATTRREPETAIEPSSPGSHPARSRRGFVVGVTIAAVVLVAVLAGGGALLLMRRAPVESRIAITSRPPGATVLVDGRDSGITTDGVIVLPAEAAREVQLTLRRPGMRDESRTVRLPAPEGSSVAVDLVPLATQAKVSVVSEPPGAGVTLDGVPVKGRTPVDLVLDPSQAHEVSISVEGFASQRLTVAPGPEPAGLFAKLDPVGPPGSVTITSPYPVDVSWHGRVLAKGQVSPTVSVPGGRQALTITAPSVFLRRDLALEVTAGGRHQASVPGLGRLSVRAQPDNCEVYLDGTFFDHPPVHDKPIAAGNRVVSYRWPDGARYEETVEVVEGKSAFSTGRKE